MAATTVQTLLAAGVLAVHAAAFVPGGVVHVPHVPLVRMEDRSGSAGEAGPPPSDQARGSLLKLAVTLRFTMGIEHAPLSARGVLEAWAEDAAGAEAAAAGEGDGAARRAAKETRSALQSALGLCGMTDGIDRRFLALKADRVEAIACVSIQDSFSGQLGSSADTVTINMVVARPTADRQRGVAGELIRRIGKQGGTTNHFVAISIETPKAYYESLGFGVVSEAVLYNNFGEDELPDRQELHMVTLDP